MARRRASSGPTASRGASTPIRSMLVGGLRALLVQALEPRAMAAVDQHSRFREDPWGRLERTTQLRDRRPPTATPRRPRRPRRRVRNVHARIHGVDPVTGRGYSAKRSGPPALDPRGRGGVVPARVPHVRRPPVAGRRRPLRRRDGARRRRWSSSPGRWRRSPRASCATTCVRCAGLQVTPAARRRAACRPVPPMHLAYRPLWAIPTDRGRRDPAVLRASDVPHPVVPGRRRSRCAPRCSRSAGR